MADHRQPSLHRLRRPHPRAPDGHARLRARRSTATASGTSRPTPTARSGCVYDGDRTPANFLSAAGVAGMSDEDRARAFQGEMRYTETRPAGWNAKARLQDMDEDHIDLAVLYPTMLLGLQSLHDVDFGEAQARAYNDWCSDHVQEGEGRLFGAGALPPMHHPDDVDARRRRDPPGRRRSPAWCRCSCGRTRRSTGGRSTTRSTTRSGRRRPTPGCPSPCTRSSSPDLPGACKGLRLARPRRPDGRYVDDFDPERAAVD